MSKISRESTYHIASIFERIGFVFRDQPIEDYGIDAIIERRNGDMLSGKLIGVQIKSGKSYFKEQTEEKVIYRGENKHFKYWSNYSLPVIIVLHNPVTDECIYEIFDKDTIKELDKGWKMEINRKNLLEESKLKLNSLENNQTNYEKKLFSLVFSRDLMKLAEKGFLVIEVDEWINKSSGRGDFKISKIENESQTVLYESTIIGFGSRPYEEVLPKVFPWAKLRIDEDFYDNYKDNNFYNKWDYDIDENCTKCDDKEIYPYDNSAGEVDHYRLIPELNEIGKSFLTLDKFLNEEEFYRIRF